MKFWLFVLLAVLFAVGVSWAVPREFSLISVDPGGASRAQRMIEYGIDVWDCLNGRITAAVTPDEMAWLDEQGFQYKVLFPTRRDLERSIPVQAGPLAIDYRNYDQVVAEIQRIAVEHPDIAQLHILGTTYENRPVYGLRITEKVHLHRSVEGFLITGLHHAREWIALEVPLRVASYIADNYHTNPDIGRKLNQLEL